MTQFEKITESPETLGAFLAALPVIDGPWDKEFQARFCADCLYLGCDVCPHEEFRNNPGWWLTLETGDDQAAEKKMQKAETAKPTKLEKWLVSLPPEKLIEEICKRGCPWCPAAEYCEKSNLRSCKEVLQAWAAEEA